MTRHDLRVRPCPFAGDGAPHDREPHDFFMEATGGYIVCRKCGEIRRAFVTDDEPKQQVAVR